jgi:hypothetical protein
MGNATKYNGESSLLIEFVLKVNSAGFYGSDKKNSNKRNNLFY